MRDSKGEPLSGGGAVYAVLVGQGAVSLEAIETIELFQDVVQQGPMGDLFIPPIFPGLGPLRQPLGLMRRLKMVLRIRAEVQATQDVEGD